MTDDKVTDGEFHIFAESITNRMRTMQWIIGGIGGAILVFLLAAIPWAMRVESNLAKLTVQVESIQVPPPWFLERVIALEKELDSLEKKHLELQRDVSDLRRP